MTNEKMKNILKTASHIAVAAGLLCLPILVLRVNPLLLFLIFPLMWGLYEWRGHSRSLALVPIFGAVLGMGTAVILMFRFIGCYEPFPVLKIGVIFFAVAVVLNKIYFQHLEPVRSDVFLNRVIYILLFGMLLCLFFVSIMNYCAGFSIKISDCERFTKLKFSFGYFAAVAYIALWGLMQSIWFTENWQEKRFDKLVWLAIFTFSALCIVIGIWVLYPFLEHKCVVGVTAEQKIDKNE